MKNVKEKFITRREYAPISLSEIGAYSLLVRYTVPNPRNRKQNIWTNLRKTSILHTENISMCRKEYNPAWASHLSQKRQKSIWKIVGLSVSNSHARWISRPSMPPLMGSARDYLRNNPRGGTSLRAGCPIIAFNYAGTSNAASLASFTAAGAQNNAFISSRQQVAMGPSPHSHLLSATDLL
jgi:hypothetical protein